MQPRRHRRTHDERVRRRPHWGRIGAIVGVIVLGGVAIVWRLQRHPNPPAARAAGSQRQSGGNAGSASPAGGTSGVASVSGTAPPVALTLRWTTLATAQTGTAIGAQEDADGSVWLLTRAGTTDQLWHFRGTAELGRWAVPDSAAITVQTVGPNHVWLGSPGTEIAFSKTAHTFHTYGGAGTLAVRTVAGHSVALDLPGGGQVAPSAAPYVEVAPLGGTGRRIPLPGATLPATLDGAVSTGPAGNALVAIDGRVWAVPVAGGPATRWASLPVGGLPGPVAWGDASLWCLIGPVNAPTGIDQMQAGQATTPLPLGRSHPPVAGTPLTFADGHLWWVTVHHLFGYDPANGHTAQASLPAATTAAVVTASPGGVWIAQGGEIAQASLATQG